jgi:hypothetical protein
LLESPAILIGGIFALIELVVAALLDFFKREPRYRYNVYSKSDSQRMFHQFLGLTIGEWVMIALVQFQILDPVIGWPLFALCFIIKLVLIQSDFVKRRMDVPNRMFRVCQWTFLCTAIALVLVSYYVHTVSRPKAATQPTTVQT